MDKIKIQNIRVYAYHGVHEVERAVGQWYVVNLELNGDYSSAKVSDDLKGTVDYSVVAELVKSEMEVPANLIEHVALRISSALKQKFSLVQTGTIELVKEFPPVKGIGAVSVTVEF